MEKNQEPIQQLNEIRSLMERSSRFISLSGLSGVSAGIIALIGAAAAYFYLDLGWRYTDLDAYSSAINANRFDHAYLFLITDALVVLLLALSAGIYFTTRKARRKGLKVWDHVARRMVINLMIPLITGGLFCIILLYHRLVFLVAPATLIFYGLALINASKYTFHEIRVLGLSEIILGLIASWLVGYGLIFWAVGFGILHIFYGLMMYYRYETSDISGDPKL
ncbi:MAG: hypothetical protein JXQ80_05200 [Bacteroidales bacterium]|nr:hypothetical protein [Bacteroidales bacterium]